MNNTIKESLRLIRDLRTGLGHGVSAEVVVCPPFTSLAAVSNAITGSPIVLGAQNLHWEPSGAFTGEISPIMLRDLGCKYVIIGHSERRQALGETDSIVNRKVLAAISNGLIPILCVGETLAQREANETQEVVLSQLSQAVRGLGAEQASNIVVAYEPVWAIGTGRSASGRDANEVAFWIRSQICEQFGEKAASQIRILYGGSVTPDNSKEFVEQPEIDGALVGGASLKAQSFLEIVKSAAKED